VLIGIGGAILGGFISTQVGYGTVTGAFDQTSLIIATGGSLIILALHRMLKRK